MLRTTPKWVLGVLVFLALQALLSASRDAPEAEILARVRALRVESDARRMSARELRQLPGVGSTLAEVLARTRDSYRGAAPLAWEDVPGIGEVRARGIREWCRAHGVEADPLAFGVGAETTSYPVEMRVLLRIAAGSFAAFAAGCGGRASESGAVAASRGPGSIGGGSEVAGSEAAAKPAASESARVEPGRTDAGGSEAVRSRMLALEGGSIHALEAGPSSGAPVLLLHGARYSARTWEELGTLAQLAHAGYHAVAIDWPGYGESPDWGDEDASRVLASVCAELGSAPVVLVGASLGGGFALEFLARSPERVAAFVGIAPAGAKSFAPAEWHVPTLLVWGERDDVLPVADGRALAERLHARFEVLAAASHPCYLDQPDRFHALLLDFVAQSRAAPGRR